MTTPSNQEIYEMVQSLEQRLSDLSRWRAAIESELEDITNRQNLDIEFSAGKADVNEAILVLRKIGAINNVDVRRALL
jgi:chaperonin cofactor prefoldin